VIAQCIGIQLQHGDALIKEVLHLEQLLTTGGGWQDQVGGLIGGLKIGRSAAHQLPLSLSVQKVPLSRERIEELNQRLVLAFTGQPRLARNILQKVLRRWARRNHEIVTTVKNLVDGANDSVLAIQDGDFDRFGSQISAYWEQKKSMAGEESGVEPPIVKEALAILKKENIIVGGTLCGAGGGGFLALLLQKGKTVACIDNALRENMKNNEFDISAFTWHKCEISEEGVRTVVEE
jgi:fucokinase